MVSHLPPFIFTVFFLIVICVTIPGCTTGPETNPRPVDLQTTFLTNAEKIQDYRSEYHMIKPDGRVRYEWKAPGSIRMEFIESGSPPSGTQYFVNRTMAIDYNPVEKKYQIHPDRKFLNGYDYQDMVQRIIKSGNYTVIGTMTENGRTLYGIEIVTEPWSAEYSGYVTSRIQAWVDPGTGLAWNISTYYPSDKVSRIIRYDTIEVNTGIPDSHFIFSVPQETEVQCGSGSGISNTDQYDPRKLSPALKPGCLDCTEALLTEPVGGFSGDYLLVGMLDYQGSKSVPNPDPWQSINYTYYSRNMSKGTVRYTVSRVSGLYSTEPLSTGGNVSIGIEPGEYSAEPNRVYEAELTARVKPGIKLHENFWIHIHADVEGAPDAITDDWVRLALDDGSPMSGAGLWHFYQTGGGYCQDVLVIPQGGSGHAPFAIRTGELDTGTATLSLIPAPCHPDHRPLRQDERPPWPAGIHATVTPANFTVRSFASFLPDMAFTVDPTVQPGDYCFSAVTQTPHGGSEYAPFTLRVISQAGE